MMSNFHVEPSTSNCVDYRTRNGDFHLYDDCLKSFPNQQFIEFNSIQLLKERQFYVSQLEDDSKKSQDYIPEKRPEWLHLLEASIDLRRCPLCKDIVIMELYFQHLKKKHPDTNAMCNIGNKLVKKATIVDVKRGDNQKMLFGMEKCNKISVSKLKKENVKVIRNLVCTSNAVETNNNVPCPEKTSLKNSKKLNRKFVIKNPRNVDPLPENIVLSVSKTVNNVKETHTLKLLCNIPNKPLLFEYSMNKKNQYLPKVVIVSDIVLNIYSPFEYPKLFAGISLSPPPSPFLVQPPIFPPLPTSPPPIDTSVYHSEHPPPPPTSPPSSPEPTDTLVYQSTSPTSFAEPILPASPPPSDTWVHQNELSPTSPASSPEPTDTLVYQIELQSTSPTSLVESILSASSQPTDTLVYQSELPSTSAPSLPEPTLPTSTSPTYDNQISLYRQPSLFENLNNVSENRLVDEKQSDEIFCNILPVCNIVGEEKCTIDPRLTSFGNIKRIYTRSDEFDDISGNEDENDDLQPQQCPQQQLFTPTYENISDDENENIADEPERAFSDLSIAFSTDQWGENLLNVSYVKNNDKRLVRISFQYDKAVLDNFTRKEILSNVRNYILSNICSLDIVEISEPKIIENVIRSESVTENFTNTLPGNETDVSISSGSFEFVDKLPKSDREELLLFNGFENNIDLNNTSDLLAAVTEIETNFVDAVENTFIQEGTRVHENALDFVRNSVLDDNDDFVIDIFSNDEEDNDDQNTTSPQCQQCQHNQKNLTQEATTSSNNASNDSGGVTIPPQAIEKVLEMLTSIYQQTSRLASLSPTQSQCGVCHHYQDSSHMAKLQEICESIKIDPKLMMTPPKDTMSTKKIQELPITIVDDDDDDVVIIDSNSNKIQKPSGRRRNSTKKDECVILETVPLQPRAGPSKRPRQAKMDKNEPKPKISKSNNIPYVYISDNNVSDDDVVLIEDPLKPSTSKSAKIESLSQLKRKYNYVESDVAESETSENIEEMDASMLFSIDENCDTKSCTISARKKLKRIKQMLSPSPPTSISTKSSMYYVSHHSTNSATSASTAISASADKDYSRGHLNNHNRVCRSDLFNTFLNPNNEYCTVTYNCDGSFRWITVNSSAKETPKQFTYRQLRKAFAIATVKREVYKSFTCVEYTDDYWIKDACDHVDDYIHYRLSTYKTDLHDILETCYGVIPKNLNPHLEKFLDDDLKYKHVNNSAFNRKKNGIDKKKMSDKESSRYSLDCDDINHYTIF